jgi:sterol desaturase/sphingolipid hydroxylase (fatty acid hydroxylase superfamily)
MELLTHLGEQTTRLGVFVAAFAAVSLFETLRPRRAMGAETGWRWLNNLLLAVVSTAFGRLFQVITALGAAWWAGINGVGILQVWQPGWVVTIPVTLLALDGTNYALHRAFHRWPLLWRTHMVHHTDTEFDVTTAYRVHPLTSLLVLVMRLPVILALGAPVAVVALYEILAVIVVFLSHGNARLGCRTDRLLRWFIVTPDFHRAHHRSEKRFTDSNFATLFPLFDHLFGTASQMSFADHDQVELGLERYRERRDHRVDQLLLLPFRSTPPANVRLEATATTYPEDVLGK